MKTVGLALLLVFATAGTFVAMQLWVSPHLPVSKVSVPQLVGTTPEQARGVLSGHGLRLVIRDERSDGRVAPGQIAEQRPLPGSELVRGDEVQVSLARAVGKVPRVEGMALQNAKQALEEAGLKVGNVTEEASQTVPAGAVIASKPPQGTETPPGSTIDLTVSQAAIAVPGVVGKRLSSAKEIFEKAGFVVGSVRQGSDDDRDPGQILKQTPAANTPAPKGTKIDLVINE